jgi:hypothetical protein
MEVGSTWHHAHDKFYQAHPLFSRVVEKIGAPGDEAKKIQGLDGAFLGLENQWCRVSYAYIQWTLYKLRVSFSDKYRWRVLLAYVFPWINKASLVLYIACIWSLEAVLLCQVHLCGWSIEIFPYRGSESVLDSISVHGVPTILTTLTTGTIATVQLVKCFII